MDFPFQYLELFHTQCGFNSFLHALPSEQASKGKKCQKFVLTDSVPSLRVLSYKKENFIPSFEVPLTSEPSSLSIGGKSKSSTYAIFVAHSNNLCGYSKKGSEVLKFETSLTEPILFSFVQDDTCHLLTASTYTTFHKYEESSFFLLRDSVLYSLSLPSTPSSLVHLSHDHCAFLEPSSDPTASVNVAAGLQDGSIVIIHVTADRLEILETIPSQSKSPSPISKLIHTYMPFLDDSTVKVLVAGHESGMLFVFVDFNDSDDGVPEFRKCYHHDFESKITGLASGKFLQSFITLMVITINGKVYSLSSVINDMNSVNSAKIKQISAEVADLQNKYNKLKTKMDSTASVAVSNNNSPSIRTKLIPVSSLSAFKLSIEGNSSISKVILTCSIGISLFANPSDTNDTSFTVIKSPSNLSGKDLKENQFLAVLLPSTKTNVVEVLFRSIEGTAGDLNISVICEKQLTWAPATRTCLKLRPLALHQVISMSEDDMSQLDLVSSVTISGSFPVSQCHRWLSQLF
ncbi:hypothetical protein GEMRC1_004051 [Eukaryota sp. GEM-RC1]